MDSWLWTPGRGLLAVASWLWTPGYGFLAVGSWLWIPGCGLLVVESWLWIPGRGFLAVGSWLEASRRLLGGICRHLRGSWEASAGIWEPPGKLLGDSWRLPWATWALEASGGTQEAPRRHPGVTQETPRSHPRGTQEARDV